MNDLLYRGARYALICFSIFMAGCVALVLLASVCSCNAPGKQSLVEAQASAEVNTTVEALAEFENKLDAVAALVCDESQRMTETAQEGMLAVNKVDNSTSDKWVNRGMLLVLGVICLLNYPISRKIRKAIWPEKGNKPMP